MQVEVIIFKSADVLEDGIVHEKAKPSFRRRKSCTRYQFQISQVAVVSMSSSCQLVHLGTRSTSGCLASICTF